MAYNYLQHCKEKVVSMNLLLTVKSLTQNRKPKSYLINIQNHNKDNQLTLQNTFVHNYQYVYRLWPCKPATRELIKIEMFENIQQKDQLVKRGEATPLINYTKTGEKFQFYGEKEEQCVLILKFRVDSTSNIEYQVSENQLQRMNKSMQRHLQKSKIQTLSYKKYLNYTDNLLEKLNSNQYDFNDSNNLVNILEAHSHKTPTSQSRRIKKQRIIGTERGLSDPKINSFRLEESYIDEQIKRQKDEGSSRVIDRKESFKSNSDNKNKQSNNKNKQKSGQQSLSKNDYLDAVVDMNEIKGNSRRQISPMQVKGRRDNDVSSQIKKRRDHYIGTKIESIIEKPSTSPLLYQIESPLQQKFKEHMIGPQPIGLQYKVIVTQTAQIEQESQKQESQNDKQRADRKKDDSNMKQHEDAAGQSNLIRKHNYPSFQLGSEIQVSKHISPKGESQKIGALRKKRLSSQNDKEVTEPQQLNITHYSINNKVAASSSTATYNISLHDFRAVLYAGNKTAPKKLVIVFEDSRYSTDTAVCSSLTTDWPQRFGIRSCRDSSSIFFRLCSVSEQTPHQEGMAESSVADIVSCNKKPYPVGYLEFDFQYQEINERRSGWRREPERNSVSLPQIKKNLMPSGLARKHSGAIQPQGNNKSNKLLGKGFRLKKQESKAGKEGEMHACRRRFTTQVASTGLGRIQQRKLKLKAKGR